LREEESSVYDESVFVPWYVVEGVGCFFEVAVCVVWEEGEDGAVPCFCGVCKEGAWCACFAVDVESWCVGVGAESSPLPPVLFVEGSYASLEQCVFVGEQAGVEAVIDHASGCAVLVCS